MRLSLLGLAFAAASAPLLLFACAEPNLDPGPDGQSESQVTEKRDGQTAKPREGNNQADTSAPPAATPPGSSTCDAVTCADGCCAGGQCFTDHTAAHCGAGGGLCPAPCGTGTTCVVKAQSYACGSVLATNYDIVLVGAKVVNANGGSLPDVYVNKGSFGKLAIARTTTKSNTLNAVWNTALGTLVNADVVGAMISVELKDDDDSSADDPLGSCAHKVTLEEVASGKVIVPKTECTLDVESVEFALNAVK